ncbi:translation elongation factor 4 [Candidatus Omnitrophota bacterium]
MNRELIRNFSIIAHIDHGKSTLADRLLEITGAIDKRNFKDQLLDDMDLERERGITIKASAVRLKYKANDTKEYILNLIDTPGHVDFTYEVAKSLTACEGALLVVDASQGIEAQTVANYHMALEQNLTIIPVINKIDLPSIDIDDIKKQLTETFGFTDDEILLASAKDGIGIDTILENIVKLVPPPLGSETEPLQALIFDSTFDTFKGVIIYVRIINGKLNARSIVKMMQKNIEHKVEELGVFKPRAEKIDELPCGSVGYLTCNLKDPQEVIVGDTITDFKNPAQKALPGYREMKPLVFCGVYPVNAKDFPSLREAMEKLRLNDSSFVFEPESSQSFGHGFRCGFLGLLHMEIAQERLEREYDLNLILTTPNVVYRITKKDGETHEVDNPAALPEAHEIASLEEPYIEARIIVPIDSMDVSIDFVKQRRGVYKRTDYLYEKLVLVFDMPLSEVIVDFYDRIKSLTRGYGSLDYEFTGYQHTKIVKLDILLNGKLCDAFSCLVYKDKAYQKARALVSKLRELIPRQMYEVAIQASADHRIIASEKIRAYGKHVTAKCYGGDITRKRKLREIQKKGKKRLKQFGNVQIPQEAFLAALKI